MTNKKVNWKLALLTLGVGVLLGGWSLYKTNQALTAASLEMQLSGWWRTADAITMPRFIVRCEMIDPDGCRSVLNTLVYAQAGFHVFPAGAGLLLMVAGVLFFIPTRKPPYRARLAILSDVRALIVNWRGDFVIPLARLGRRLLGIQHAPRLRRFLKHILVIAPTQSGKSVHAKGVMAEFNGSVALVDIKGELVRDTGSYRKEVGRIFVLNPRTCVHHYNPFADIGSDPSALRAIAELLITDRKDNDPVFANRAIPAFVAALRAAQTLGLPPLSYIDDLVSGGAHHFIVQLQKVGDRDPLVRRNLINYLGTTPEEFDMDSLNDARGFISSSWNTMLGRLQPFFEPPILEMMKRTDFSATDLAQDTTTVYLSWPEELVDANAGPLALILHGLITGMNREADKGRKAAVPTLFLLDEATRYYVPALPTYITTMLGRGISALIYIQDEQQLHLSYPRSAKTIINNCKAKLYFSPAGETAEALSRALGHVSTTVTSRQLKDRSRSEHHLKRELMTADEINVELGADEVILSVDGFRKVRGRRLEWFKNAKLKRRLGGEPLHIPGVTVFDDV